MDVPGIGYSKINAAMQNGGATLAIRTINRLLGKELRVNHVVFVDFNQLSLSLIDAVGGITVDVPENILSNKFDCPYPGEQVRDVERLELPEGTDAHDRPPGADLLSHP